MGVPITPDAISAMTFVSSDAKAHPHVVADWKQATRLARHRFDVVTTACCSYDTFIEPATGALCSVAFSNIERVLKPGGYFVFITAFKGEAAFASRVRFPFPASSNLLTRTKETQLLHRLGQEIQTQHPQLQLVSHASVAARRWTSSLSRHFGGAGYSLPDDLLLFKRV